MNKAVIDTHRVAGVKIVLSWMKEKILSNQCHRVKVWLLMNPLSQKNHCRILGTPKRDRTPVNTIKASHLACSYNRCSSRDEDSASTVIVQGSSRCPRRWRLPADARTPPEAPGRTTPDAHFYPPRLWRIFLFFLLSRFYGQLIDFPFFRHKGSKDLVEQRARSSLTDAARVFPVEIFYPPFPVVACVRTGGGGLSDTDITTVFRVAFFSRLIDRWILVGDRICTLVPI